MKKEVRRTKYKRLLSLLTAAVLLMGMLSIAPNANADGTAFSLPPLYGKDSSQLLSNPDRGFRHELNAFAGTGTEMSGYTDMRAVWAYKGELSAFKIMGGEIDWYESDSPKLAQVYFYLTKYTGTDTLDQDAFDSMDAYFEMLKAYGLKAVLRFTYAHSDGSVTSGDGELYTYRNTTPGVERAMKHINQLSPWIEKWEDQIHVLQAGIIGAWGEWDSGSANSFNNNAPANTYPLDRDGNALAVCTGGNRGQRALLITLLENIPDSMHLQVRYEYNKYDNFTASDSEYYSRIGFHDDSIRGSALFSNNTGGANQASTGYQNVRSESAHTLVDGEMYWGSSNTGGKDGAGPGTDDGLFHFVHMKERHFTSLSIVHNYKENGKNIAGIGTSMVEWQNEYVNKSVLSNRGLPFDPAWLKNEKGQPLARSLFEYVRDYLGYYLKAESGGAKVNGGEIDISLTLKNYGFSAPHGLKHIKLVLIDSEGNAVSSETAFVLDDLQPLEAKTANVTLTVPAAGTYKIALDMRSSTGEGARIANDIEFDSAGYNILAEVVI